MFARMHREERVAFAAYDAFALAEVLDQLEVASALCAVTFTGLDGAAWERRFVYSWPEPAEHDLRWLGGHTVHEGVHHLFDVQRILRAARTG